MELQAGTSGYSFKEWLGKFYPEHLPADEMLHHYATQLPTVEINTSFYGMPRRSSLTAWAEQVPEHFTFALKAPQKITHKLKLREAEDATLEFMRRAQLLEPKLACVLFLLPPYLKKDLPLLRDFLALMPQGAPAAFEFRSSSWQNDEVHSLLHDHGAMLCVADKDEGDTPFVVTGRDAYVRLRRTHYDDAALGEWVERIAMQTCRRTYVYFMHEDEALGAVFAKRLLELWRARGA
jgi:uncharacterized protein YecE (DUF72 family)